VLLPHSQMSLKTRRNFLVGEDEYNPVDYAQRFRSTTAKVKPREDSIEEHSDQSCQLGRKLEHLREQFGITDRSLKIVTDDPPPGQKLFDCLEPQYEYLLLKELLYREDFKEFLLRTMGALSEKKAFARLVTPKNVYRLILNADSAADVTKIFTNMLLSCRLLAPIAQKEIYDNLGALNTAATRMARVYGENSLNAGSVEVFYAALFEFDTLPLSYSNAATTREDHFFAFIETMWDLFPSILESFYPVGRLRGKFWKFYAEKIYEAVRMPKFEGETWEAIVNRIAKKWDHYLIIGGIYHEDRTPGEATQGDSIANKELYYFIHSVAGNLSELVEVFQDHSEQGKKTQWLVTELLHENLSISAESFTGYYNEQLEYLRQIRKLSYFRDKNLLLRGYKKLLSDRQVKFNDDYSDDILQGLGEDEESWMTVFQGFLACERPPRSRVAYDSFIGPIRNLFRRLELSDLNKDFYAVVAEVFAKLLHIRKSATSEDWILLLRSEYFKVKPDIFIRLLREISLINLDEKAAIDLTIHLLNNKKLEPSSVLAMIRLMETSKNPVNLAKAILKHFETCPEDDLKAQSSALCIWNFLAVVAKIAQTSDFHLLLLSLVLRTLKLRRKKKFELNAAAIFEMISFVTNRNLCTSEDVYHSLKLAVEESLDHSFLNATEYFYFILILYRINASQNYRSVDEAPTQCIQNLSHLFQLHRTAPQSITAEVFSSSFRGLLNVFEKSVYDEHDRQEKFQYAQIILQVLEEFHSESYFDEARSTLLMSNNSDARKSAYYPKLMLLEAKNYLNQKQRIPDAIKKYLASTEYCIGSWLFWWQSDNTVERYLLLRTEHENAVKESAKIFSEVIDSCSVRFFANIFFLYLNHDEIYVVPIFTQLARL
jgi:hypothetical protein